MKEAILPLYRQLFATDQVSFANLEIMAERLSQLANRQRPWTAKFLDSLIHEYRGFEDYHSEPLALALQILNHELNNGTVAMVVSTSAVISHIPLPPGTVIQGEVKQCTCGLWFVPKWHSQKYHDKKCKSKARYLRRLLKKEKTSND